MSFENTSNPEYSKFIALSKYARWLPEMGRRETWEETVQRYVDFFVKRFPVLLETDGESPCMADLLEEYIVNLEVMPSMRALMTAGIALDKDNVAGFNCAYRELSGSGKKLEIYTQEMKDAGITSPISISISKPTAFDETMYILMCGTGLGFSCERQFIGDLPIVGFKLPRKIYEATQENYPGVEPHKISTIENNIITVLDSKYGWASALRILIIELYNGNFDVKWDVSLVRPSGAPLVTFGGRASGPEPLVNLFEYCVDLFKRCHGRKLTSIETHGLVCKIAEIVVVGGVRRSALISLSNLSDDRMRHAKSGNWYDYNKEYSLANNSVCYTEKPDSETFMREWLALIESKSGERGIFNRQASKKRASMNGRRDATKEFGTNPCSEIILRNQQFCNLSEVVVRPNDTVQSLLAKVRIATVIGTLQSSLTDFKYINEEWSKNTKEEALLGVSMSGIMDHRILSNGATAEEKEKWPCLDFLLELLRGTAIETNQAWSKIIGVNQSAAITCVKPSGTVSQLVDSASGIHPRYSEYYIRTVRADKKDPLALMMIDKGFPVEDDVMAPSTTLVFSFPMKAPEGSVFRDDRTALEQLEHWILFQRYWCEHKPSVTIYVKDEEWMSVGAWVWERFDEISGISFLPHTDHSYKQAPYKEITKEEYEDWLQIMPEGVDWSDVGEYEYEDNTTSSQTLACSGPSCEIVDLG